ncbi:hypothetical protein DL765_002875 [Monosporascus sp. GIB2]|nr:hypothetical protein DL765_002875 [Monosporascus sp. GIB2]
MRHELVKFDRDYVAAQVGTCEDDAEYNLSDENARLLEEILSAETTGRGRPKALCYEDILLMVIRHPVTGEDVHAMAVKFIHYKGVDNKPKPIAINDSAFDAPSLTNVRAVFEVKNTGPVTYDMARQSLDAGEEKFMQPKDWRRGAMNEANAPDAVRNQIIRHDPKWATFNSAYINAKRHARSARGEDGQEDKEYAEPVIDLQIPERAQLAKILCNQPEDLSHENLLSLRIQAAELWVALCGKRETAWLQYLDLPAIKKAMQADRWNMDETGLMQGMGPNGLISTRYG